MSEHNKQVAMALEALAREIKNGGVQVDGYSEDFELATDWDSTFATKKKRTNCFDVKLTCRRIARTDAKPANKTEQYLEDIKQIVRNMEKDNGVTVESIYFDWSENMRGDRYLVDANFDVRTRE